MYLFILYTIILIVGLSVYLFKSKNLTVSDFVESYKFINDILKNKFNSSTAKTEATKIAQTTTANDFGFRLNKSLKHLEYINGLESYATNAKSCSLTLDCLKELESSKLHAQIATLRSTLELSTCYNTRAA